MNRRGFLSFLGLAPVVAVTPAKPKVNPIHLIGAHENNWGTRLNDALEELDRRTGGHT